MQPGLSRRGSRDSANGSVGYHGGMEWARTSWRLLALAVTATGCAATHPAATKTVPPEAAPEVDRAEETASEPVRGFLAACRAEEALVLVAEVQGSEVLEVDPEADVPPDLSWTAASGGGTVAAGQERTLQDSGVHLRVVGSCDTEGSLWSSFLAVSAGRPDLPAADALEAMVEERAEQSAAERTERRETSFAERDVTWLQTGEEPVVYLRVSVIESSWSECEPPAEEGMDSTCGSSEETSILVGRAGEGLGPATVEVLVESLGC